MWLWLPGRLALLASRWGLLSALVLRFVEPLEAANDWHLDTLFTFFLSTVLLNKPVAVILRTVDQHDIKVSAFLALE